MQASPLVCRAGVSAEAENRDGGKGGRLTAAEQQTGLMEDNEKREMNETVFMTCYCVCVSLRVWRRERDTEKFKNLHLNQISLCQQPSHSRKNNISDSSWTVPETSNKRSKYLGSSL